MDRRPTWPLAVAGLGVLIAVVSLGVSLIRGCGPTPTVGSEAIRDNGFDGASEPGHKSSYVWDGGHKTQQGDRVDASGRLSLSFSQDFPGVGRYSLTFPFAQTDRDWTLTISVEQPRRGPRSQVAFLFRQVNLNSWPPVSGGVESAGGGEEGMSFRTHLDFASVNRDAFVAGYSWSRVAAGDVTETMTLADKPYQLADGRVFLLDLLATPVKVLQVNDDLAALLPRNSPTAEELRAVWGKLEAKHENARTFWTR